MVRQAILPSQAIYISIFDARVSPDLYTSAHGAESNAAGVYETVEAPRGEGMLAVSCRQLE